MPISWNSLKPVWRKYNRIWWSSTKTMQGCTRAQSKCKNLMNEANNYFLKNIIRTQPTLTIFCSQIWRNSSADRDLAPLIFFLITLFIKFLKYSYLAISFMILFFFRISWTWVRNLRVHSLERLKYSSYVVYYEFLGVYLWVWIYQTPTNWYYILWMGQEIIVVCSFCLIAIP